MNNIIVSIQLLTTLNSSIHFYRINNVGNLSHSLCFMKFILSILVFCFVIILHVILYNKHRTDYVHKATTDVT